MLMEDPDANSATVAADPAVAALSSIGNITSDVYYYPDGNHQNVNYGPEVGHNPRNLPRGTLHFFKLKITEDWTSPILADVLRNQFPPEYILSLIVAQTSSRVFQVLIRTTKTLRMNMICREWKTKDWVWENTELGKSYVEKKAHILEITADVDMVIEESTRSESGIPPRRKRKLLELNDTENNSDDQSENRRCKSTEILNAIRRKVNVSGKINDIAVSSVGSLASGIESMNDALTDDEEAKHPEIVVSRAAHMLHLLNNHLTESEPETLDSLIKIFHYQGIHPKSFQTKLLQHLLSPSSSRKALALIGPPDCGKRFILDALREIFKVSLVGMGGSSMIVELPQTTSVIHVPHSSSQSPTHTTSSSPLASSFPQSVDNHQGINIGGSKFANLLEADIVVLEHVTSLIRSNTLSEAEFLHLLSDTSIFSVPTLKLTPSTQELNQQQPVYVMSNVPVPKLPVIYVADDMNLRGIESREEALSKLETLARFKRNGTPLFKAGKPDGRAMAWFLCRWTG